MTDLADLQCSPQDSLKHILWVVFSFIAYDIYVWSILINYWRISLIGYRSNRGNFCCIWRNYCSQHGRFAPWSLLVCHIFLDSCGCKFFLLKLTFHHDTYCSSEAIHPWPYHVTLCLIFDLLQCFPSAIASHVVSEYPNKCLVSTRQYSRCWSPSFDNVRLFSKA